MIISACSVALTGCSNKAAQKNVEAMGNATPAASPQANPEGDVAKVSDQILDMGAAGNKVGVLTAGKLSLDGKEVTVAESCKSLSHNADFFVLPCGDHVEIVHADGAVEKKDQAADAAAMTASGTLITAKAGSKDVTVAGGKTFKVDDTTDKMIADGDNVVRINRTTTTIQDIDYHKNRQGGTLRVGKGVGDISGRDGVVLAGDTIGNQLAVYTADDVIRLHQTTPVAESPWAVAWDSKAKLAWAASTATNTAQGFEIAGGVPQQKRSVRTIANVRHMGFLNDGTMVLSSEHEVQKIKPAP